MLIFVLAWARLTGGGEGHRMGWEESTYVEGAGGEGANESRPFTSENFGDRNKTEPLPP